MDSAVLYVDDEDVKAIFGLISCRTQLICGG